MSTAILDIPEVRQRVHRLSVDQYERFVELGAYGKQHELIRGLVIKKMSKSPLHGSISKRLYDFFLMRVPPDFSVRQERPLRLVDSEPEPDVAIVRGTDADYFDRQPTTAVLVVEVAISSAALDRENAALYAEAGVEEFWIVLPREKQIDVYRRPEAGVYRDVQTIRDGALECSGLAGISVVLSELFR